MMSYKPTPIIQLDLPELRDSKIKILVKCEYLNHPFVSGNKWWKLKYNLDRAIELGQNTILTFGGAYSNHIYATAGACHELGLKSIGIIRGEETLPLNPTLSFAKECGMELHYVSREAYRRKSEPSFLQNLTNQFGDFYLIPEGGTNALAVKGVIEFVQSLNQEAEFDYLCLPVGTGGTMAGLIAGMNAQIQVVGISVLKNGEFLVDEVKGHLKNFSDTVYGNWYIKTSYHHGGYAKTNSQLFAFMDEMKTNHNLPLDPVYTAKLMWGVLDMVAKGKFKRGSTVLVVHTGGLQGLQGFR